MNWNELQAIADQYVMQTHHRIPIDLDHGKGATLYDSKGRAYIDFAGGDGTMSLGYGHAQLAETLLEQTLKLGHASHTVYTEPAIALARRLCQRSGMANACFVSSGSEANEAMIKLARKYSYDRYGPGRGTILTLEDAFHGTSITTLSASGQEQASPCYGPLTPGFRTVEATMEAIRAQRGSDICAVMLELIQQDGSVVPLSRAFLHALAVYCAEHDWLLLIDEVQTGIGRCGTLFAYQQYGILPDVVSFAGGIAGGLPLGGILANNRCKDVFVPARHSSTFGGSPICAAAALTVLDILNEDTLAKVKEEGEYLRSGLDALGLPIITGISGQGLLVGVQLRGNRPPRDYALLLADFGLLCQPTQDGLLFTPPLLITKAELDRGLGILKQALVEGAETP